MSKDINVLLRSQSLVQAPCVFKTIVLKSALSFAEQVVQDNTKYVVKWNYNLRGQHVNIPAYCILDFDGGRLSNGSIHWENTKIFNPYKYEILDRITESGDKIIL